MEHWIAEIRGRVPPITDFFNTHSLLHSLTRPPRSGALSRVTRRRAVAFVLASVPAGADPTPRMECIAIHYESLGLEVLAVLPDGSGIMRISPRRFAWLSAKVLCVLQASMNSQIANAPQMPRFINAA
jgi:hypothetical protein